MTTTVGPRRTASRRGQRGVTLIELMIGVAIIALILMGLTSLLRETQRAYSQGSTAADLQGDVRAALDQITHDLRRAGRNARGTCIFAAFPAGNNTSVQIQRDLDNNGAPPGSCINTGSGSEEQITLSYNSGTKTLTRRAGSGTPTVLGRNIEAPGGTIFRYWYLPQSGTVCNTGVMANTTVPTNAQLTCTRRITVTLRGNVTSAAGPVTRTVRTDVDIRDR